jgi:flagellar biosynthesis/type III secretory pathway chaperone
MNQRLDEKKLYYQQVITIWEDFCHLHKDLYDITCDEYLTLLASDIDKLETMLPLKEEIIQRIGELERERHALIDRLNELHLGPDRITKISELLKMFSDIEDQSPVKILRNLNDLLIDMIEKIQAQNKKNQIFLNKAMLSLKDLRTGFSGKKAFTTYGADGMTRANGR